MKNKVPLPLAKIRSLNKRKRGRKNKMKQKVDFENPEQNIQFEDYFGLLVKEGVAFQVIPS